MPLGVNLKYNVVYCTPFLSNYYHRFRDDNGLKGIMVGTSVPTILFRIRNNVDMKVQFNQKNFTKIILDFYRYYFNMRGQRILVPYCVIENNKLVLDYHVMGGAKVIRPEETPDSITFRQNGKFILQQPLRL